MQNSRNRIENLAITGIIIILAAIFTTPSIGQGFTYHWGHPSPQGNIVYGMAFSDAMHGWAVTGCGSVLETTDGGESWALGDDPDSLCSDLYDIVISEQGTLIISGDHGGIKRSTDDGEIWEVMDFPAAGRLYDLCLIPGGGISTAGQNGTVLVSFDDGVTWTNKGPGGIGYARHHVWKSALEGYVVGDDLFHRTTDGGDSWTEIAAPGAFGLNEIYFTSDNTGYAIEDFAFWKTTDGGATWTFENVFTSPLYRFRTYVIDDLHWFTVTFLEGGELWETTDGGANWEQLMFHDCTGFTCLIENGDKLFFGSDLGDIFFTADGGATFQNAIQNLAVFPSAPIAIIGSRPDGTLFANNLPNSGVDNGTFFRSDDGGFSWYIPEQTPGLRWVTDIEFYDNQLGVLGSYAEIRFTADGGETWGESSLPENYNLSKLSLASPERFFAGTYASWPNSGGNLFHSDDSGHSWEVVSRGLPVNNIRVTCLDFFDANTGYVASLDGDQVSLYKTTDGGESWEWIDQSGIPGYMADMLWLDENTGLAAVPNFEEAGIYRTNDGGLNWIRVSATSASQFTADNNGFIAALYAGDEIFQESDDGGITWQPHSPPFSSSIAGYHGTVHSIQVTGSGYILGGVGNRLMVAEREAATGVDFGDDVTGSGRSIQNIAIIPNPVRGQAVIMFNLAEGSHVTLTLFNGFGKQVAMPFNSWQKEGEHQMEINAEALPAGIYFYRIQAGSLSGCGKMVVVR